MGQLPALTVAAAARGGEGACRSDTVLPVSLADTEKAGQHPWDMIRSSVSRSKFLLDQGTDGDDAQGWS